MFSNDNVDSYMTLITQMDTRKFNYYGHHFSFEVDKVIGINYWPLEPAFRFYTNHLSSYWF